MPLSSQGIAARWLLFTAALTTFPHLAKADGNFTDFDWLNETQLLAMFEYENSTEENFMEDDMDVEEELESLYVGETVNDTIDETIGETIDETVDDLTTFFHLAKADGNFTDFDWLNETHLLAMFEYENTTEENFMEDDMDVEEELESLYGGETVNDTIDETIGETIDETVDETNGETIDETNGDTVNETIVERVGETMSEVLGETVDETVGENVGETVIAKSNESSIMDSPFEKLRLHRHYSRIVFMVVLLHVAVVGVCITIYSLVFCKIRTLKQLQRAKAQRCLQLMNLQSQHVPNARECPCSGCIMTREMLQGLNLQHLHELVEC